MLPLTFIEIHKRSLNLTGKHVSATNPTILIATSIQSVATYNEQAVIELIGQDRGTFSVAESYDEVVGRISQAGDGKVNRADSQEVARG
jgi:hypothetical protein